MSNAQIDALILSLVVVAVVLLIGFGGLAAIQ